MNKHRMPFIIFFALLTAMVLVVSSVGAAPKDGPVVSLSTFQDKYSAGQDVLIAVSISNPTNHSVRILKWFTPVDQVEEALFDVKVDGKPVSYTGPIYKRPAATGNDYITVKAGESANYQVNLGDYYDLSTTGQYEVYYKVASYNLFNEKGNGFKSRDTLTSEPISIKVEGRTPKGKPTPPPPGGTTFKACTTAQQAILKSARNQAKTYASESEVYLNGHNYSTPRYVEWFGLFDTSRYNTVSLHFTALSDAWDNAGVKFDCSCKQNYYAYVYPNRPYNIYLCNVFWQVSLSGTDSQGGTLIHEMSHFTVVAGTDDYIYGQAGARSLAISNPDNAIMNADNHEYFAENNPPKQ